MVTPKTPPTVVRKSKRPRPASKTTPRLETNLAPVKKKTDMVDVVDEDGLALVNKKSKIKKKPSPEKNPHNDGMDPSHQQNQGWIAHSHLWILNV